jgi:hypothetical protein
MQNWYSQVRLLKDVSDKPYTTEKITHRIFYDLKRWKVREKGKFKNRMGPEFEQWIEKLNTEFDKDLLYQVISDDEFWELTINLTLGI